MHYFTRAWADGELDDAEVARARDAYRQRVKELRPQMPPAVESLATAINLHDGLFERVVCHRQRRRVDLWLVCGNIAHAYSLLRLHYSGVAFSEDMIEQLSISVRNDRTEILYDEVDRDAADRWQHRILLWPDGEIGISFASLSLTRSPRPDRRLQRLREPFELVD